MQLACPGCRAKILAEDVNLDRGLAKCRSCQAVFEFTVEVAPKPRGEVAPPSEIRSWAMGRELVLALRWFHPALFFLAFFCVAWDSFLVFWYTMALRAPQIPWLMVVFPVAHVAVGVGITYSTLAGFLNRTTIKVVDGALSIRHGPLPWMGSRDLETDRIDQLFARVKERGSDDSRGSYELWARLRDGVSLKLLGGLTEDAQALYLEQELERHLGIEDRPVPGELER